MINILSIFFVFGLASTSMAATASCRGQVDGYGHFAFSITSGIVGRLVLRGCGVVGDIAKHFGEAPKNYDTFVMAGFGGVECKEITDTPYSVSCKMRNELMAEALRDDIGVEFRKTMQFGGIQFQQTDGDNLAFEFWSYVPGHTMLKKKFVMVKPTCNNNEIQPDEGKCP